MKRNKKKRPHLALQGMPRLCIASFLRAACASQDQTMPKYITVSIPRSEKRSTHGGGKMVQDATMEDDTQES